MAWEYSGVLALKLPGISVLGAQDVETRLKYERAAMERHDALFREFRIEPPAPDATGDPAWRELALALARRHVPAFAGKAGRPATSRDENMTWFLASCYFERRHDLAARDADRMVAKHFGVEERTVVSRLKDLRRETVFRADGAMRATLDRTEKLIGRDGIIEALGEVLNPKPEFNEHIASEIERLTTWPY